jgi:hypothetical protein
LAKFRNESIDQGVGCSIWNMEELRYRQLRDSSSRQSDPTWWFRELEGNQVTTKVLNSISGTVIYRTSTISNSPVETKNKHATTMKSIQYKYTLCYMGSSSISFGYLSTQYHGHCFVWIPIPCGVVLFPDSPSF